MFFIYRDIKYGKIITKSRRKKVVHGTILRLFKSLNFNTFMIKTQEKTHSNYGVFEALTD